MWSNNQIVIAAIATRIILYSVEFLLIIPYDFFLLISKHKILILYFHPFFLQYYNFYLQFLIIEIVSYFNIFKYILKSDLQTFTVYNI